jgi:hypothetical protein
VWSELAQHAHLITIASYPTQHALDGLKKAGVEFDAVATERAEAVRAHNAMERTLRGEHCPKGLGQAERLKDDELSVQPESESSGSPARSLTNTSGSVTCAVWGPQRFAPGDVATAVWAIRVEHVRGGTDCLAGY